jgi:hypothetical protein
MAHQTWAAWVVTNFQYIIDHLYDKSLAQAGLLFFVLVSDTTPCTNCCDAPLNSKTLGGFARSMLMTQTCHKRIDRAIE